MFAGMMIGAVGWGTCGFPLLLSPPAWLTSPNQAPTYLDAAQLSTWPCSSPPCLASSLHCLTALALYALRYSSWEVLSVCVSFQLLHSTINVTLCRAPCRLMAPSYWNMCRKQSNTSSLHYPYSFLLVPYFQRWSLWSSFLTVHAHPNRLPEWTIWRWCQVLSSLRVMWKHKTQDGNTCLWYWLR